MVVSVILNVEEFLSGNILSGPQRQVFSALPCIWEMVYCVYKQIHSHIKCITILTSHPRRSHIMSSTNIPFHSEFE
jgi:hypothetical protein